MAKYVVKARAGIDEPAEEELDGWTEEDYRTYLQGDKEKEQEVRGIAHELVSLDFWVEKVEDVCKEEESTNKGRCNRYPRHEDEDDIW